MGWGNPKKTKKYAKWGKAPAKASHSSWPKTNITPKSSSVLQKKREASIEVIIFNFEFV